jgi:hypothetical protein
MAYRSGKLYIVFILAAATFKTVAQQPAAIDSLQKDWQELPPQEKRSTGMITSPGP